MVHANPRAICQNWSNFPAILSTPNHRKTHHLLTKTIRKVIIRSPSSTTHHQSGSSLKSVNGTRVTKQSTQGGQHKMINDTILALFDRCPAIGRILSKQKARVKN